MQPIIKCHKPPFTLKELKVEVTYNCSLNCIHCSSDACPSNKIEMSIEDCLKIVSASAKLGAKKIAFSGGEPLLWKNILDAIECAVKNEFEVTVYTSGNVNDFDEKASELKRLNILKIVFSIFGATEETHERITRKKGSFEKTREAMLHSKKIGLRTEIHFVPMVSNYEELKQVASFGKENGALGLSILRLVPQGRATILSQQILNKIQNLKLRNIVLDLRRKNYNVRTGSPYNFLMLNDNPECCAAIDRIIIGPDLRIYPCDAFKQIKAEEIVGTLDWSLVDNNFTLPDCWEKSPYLNTIRTYLTTDFHEPCSSCSTLSRCLSGCLAQKVIAFGNLQKHLDPGCIMN